MTDNALMRPPGLSNAFLPQIDPTANSLMGRGPVAPFGTAPAGEPLRQTTGWLGLLSNIANSALTGNYLSSRGDIRSDIGGYLSMMGRHAARDLREMATNPENMVGTGTLGAPLGIAAAPGRSIVRSMTKAWDDELRSAVQRALDAEDAYYGIRISEKPLEVGSRAPESRQWYQDFISETDPHYGRERFPDHNEPLGGTATIGLRSLDDLRFALEGLYGSPPYFGDSFSLLRARRRLEGNDPREWILPDAEVIGSWRRPKQ